MKTKKYYFWFSLIVALFYWFHPQSSYSYTYLKPDGVTTINVNRTVNVVLIGFQPGSGPLNINEAALRSKLDPLFISPVYEQEGVGYFGQVAGNALQANMNYNIIYATPTFEDNFFDTLLYLALGAYGPQYGSPQLGVSTYLFAPDGPCPTGVNEIYPTNDGSGYCAFASVPTDEFGNPVPLGITPFQMFYNFFNKGANSRLILQNFFIDAPIVEKILAGSVPSLASISLPTLGVDVKNPTVVLINWWSRPACDLSNFPNNLTPGCFVDHVYTKTNLADPDTGRVLGSVDLLAPNTGSVNIPYDYIPMTERTVLPAWGMTAKNNTEDCPPTGCDEARIWFFDTSVVEGWVGNYDILSGGGFGNDGNGWQANLRLPPIWEYTNPIMNFIPTNSINPAILIPNVPDNAVACANPAYLQYNGGVYKYRDYNDLTSDLGKLINESFTAMFVAHTPVYTPWFLGRARHPDKIQLDVNIYDHVGDDAANRFLHTNKLQSMLQQLMPTGPAISVEKNSLLFEKRAKQTYGTYNQYDFNTVTGTDACGDPIFKINPGEGFLSHLSYVPSVGWMDYAPFEIGNSLYGKRIFGWAFADLVAYQSDALFGTDYSYFLNRLRFQAPALEPLPSDIQAPDVWHPNATGHGILEGDQGAYGYEIPSFVYHMPDELMNFSYLGLAESNYGDSGYFRQTFAFATDSPLTSDYSGVGFTWTLAHENGHHLGMSHPFNGYYCPNAASDPNCADMRVLGMGGGGNLARYGNFSNSIMSYLRNSNSFSQADQDSMASYLLMAYFHNNNGIFGKIKGHKKLSKVTTLLNEVDSLSGQAINAYNNLQNETAVTLGKRAHQKMLQAVDSLGVVVQSPVWQVPYRDPPDVRIKSRNAARKIDDAMKMARDTHEAMMLIPGSNRQLNQMIRKKVGNANLSLPSGTVVPKLH